MARCRHVYHLALERLFAALFSFLPFYKRMGTRALINPQENFAESMNHGGRKQAKANSQIDLAIEKVKALLGE